MTCEIDGKTVNRGSRIITVKPPDLGFRGVNWKSSGGKTSELSIFQAQFGLNLLIWFLMLLNANNLSPLSTHVALFTCGNIQTPNNTSSNQVEWNERAGESERENSRFI